MKPKSVAIGILLVIALASILLVFIGTPERELPDSDAARGSALATTAKLTDEVLAGSEATALAGTRSLIARSESQADTHSKGTQLLSSDSPEVDWRVLLGRIRAAEWEAEPHRAGWPAVEDLARAIEAGAAVPDDKPIADEVEGLLRDPLSESTFVRGALLIALGLVLDGEPARVLAGEFIEGSPGEVVRAAWLVMGLSFGKGEVRDGQIDLVEFESFHSGAVEEIWPISLPFALPGPPLELALSKLLPATLYTSAPDIAGQPEDWKHQGISTRETIVLSMFAGAVQAPGPARDWLFSWALDSDMKDACLWSLCLAARTDEGLANSIRDLVLQLGTSSLDGQLLAGLLGNVGHRGDLVLGLLTSVLRDTSLEWSQSVFSLIGIGDLLDSSDPELAAQALQTLVDIALDPNLSGHIRKLTLAQLSAAEPEQASDAIELILISQDATETRTWAAMLARFPAPGEEQRMRDLLISTYGFDEASLAATAAYVGSLISLGGEDVQGFLSGIAETSNLDAKTKGEIYDFLDASKQ